MKIKSIDPKRLENGIKSPFVLLGVAGIILLGISERLPEPQTTVTRTSVDSINTNAMFYYEEQLERRLEQLICQISGAGETLVMVTLSTSAETVFATDIQKRGGEDTTETHVFSKDGSALSETTLSPVICGVAVICQGGGDITTVSRITEMLSSLLDLPTNRISVQKMK